MRTLLPESITGYELNQAGGYFSFIHPESSENECGNPSAEYSLDGFLANGAGSTINRTVEWQSRGAFGIKVNVPGFNQGIKFGLTTSAGSYAFSFDFQGVRGYEYACGIFLQSDWSVVGRRKFIASGNIERIYCTGSCSAVAHWFVVNQLTDSVNTFYTDGWQIENKSYPTTYFDGDSSGFLRNKKEYYWSGRPHLSSSIRLGTTRSGGREYRLEDLGVHVTGFSGLGINSVVNNYSEISGGGAYYHNSIYKLRNIIITGRIFGNGTVRSINDKLSDIIDIVKPSAVPVKQPLVIRYHSTDECGQSDGHVYNIICTYVGGLEGNIDNLYQHSVAIEFEQYSIYLEKDFDKTFAIMEQVQYSSIGNIFRRDYTGKWESMGSITYAATPLAKWVNMYKSPEDKVLFIHGLFDDVAGVTCNNIAYYSPTGWTPLGTGGNYGANDQIHSMVVVGSQVYVVGDFTTVANGTVAASKVARYDRNTGTWYSMIGGSAFDGGVFTCAYDAGANILYIGGGFTTIGGVSYERVARIDLTTNTLMPNIGNLNAVVNDMLYHNGKLYVFGLFDDADGVSGASRAVIYDIAQDVWMAIGDSATVFATTYPVSPVIDKGGNLYVIKFSTKEVYQSIGAEWGWSIRSTFISSGQDYHQILGVDTSGNVYFDSRADQPQLSYPIYKYNRGSYITIEDFGRKLPSGWAHFDPVADYIPSNGFMEEAYFAFTEDCYLFNNWRTITVESEEVVYPKIEIYGPMNICTIKNFTTSQSLDFIYYPATGNRIGPHEKITIDFRGGVFNIESDSRDNPNNIVSATSSFDFHLNMGDNYITTNFYNNSEVYSDWNAQINSIEGLTGIDFDNTNNGILYIDVVDIGAGDFKVNLYSDAAKTDLVAHSNNYSAASSTLAINEDSSSGIGGTIDVEDPVAATEIYFKFGYILIYTNTSFISAR